MVYIGSFPSFVKFGGQTSKNVHDVRKVCLEMVLCVYACFVKFYMFILDEVHVRVTKRVYKHDWVLNVQENIPKDQSRVLYGGPKLGVKAAQDSPKHGAR